MPNQPMDQANYEYGDGLMQAQGEILELVLGSQTVYPWNLAEPESEAYFRECEQQFNLLESSSPAEIETGTEALFSQLHSCWSSVSQDALLATLVERFGNLVPKSWLQEISQQAQDVVEANISHTRKLVQTVQPLLSNWVEADLEVFARPFAYATRGRVNEELESALDGESFQNWHSLSHVKQARYTVMIAHYALLKLRAK